ncbi:MAG TPA: hypothetical protein VJ782_07900 [Aeromicrobium sp.]|nr:hypothetical protein [Aeromicrobium sp.]
MTTLSIVVAGLGLLLLVAAGVVILWVFDARRAEHVAADPERVEGQPSSKQNRHWWPRTSGHR